MALKVGYFARESATNLRRHKLMTAAGILTAAVSLLLLGGVLTLTAFVADVTGDIERRVEVSVFLNDDITEEQEEDIRDTLEGLEVVRRVGYVSKEEAYEEFKQLYRDQPVLWENIDADVLPASFRIEMADAARVDVIRSRLSGNPAVEEVADQRETVERLVRFTGLLRGFSGIMVLILFGAAVLLIANTIQLGIHSRRKEIDIMKHVGATNWFVRVPFMIEGVVAGLVGGAVALAILILVRWRVAEYLPVWLPRGSLQGVDFTHVLWILGLGAIIGALASAVAMRRFLDP